MKAKVILNPYAGRWIGLKRKNDLISALSSAGISYELVQTEHPGHGTQLAAQAIEQGFDVIIAAGGDGSISEVMNGMMIGNPNRSNIPLGIMPLGSANDLVVNLGLSKNLDTAARIIASAKTRRMDLGVLIHGPSDQTRYFDNNSAIGLEPSITLIQQRIKSLRGIIRYLVATLIGIAQNPQWRMLLEWEGGEYEGPATLVTIGNNPLTGGMFYMTPHANPYDGLLTFVYGYMPTRRKILQVLPMTMKPGPGSYVEHPDIHEVNSTWLRIRTETPTPLHADGEIQSKAVQAVEYRVVPGAIPVILG